jgi:hypothetical protein
VELSDCRWCQDLYKGFLMTHTCIIMSALLPAKRPWDEGTVSHNKHQKNINNIFKNIRAKVLVKHRTKRISVFILCIALKGRSASEQEGRMNKYLGIHYLHNSHKGRHTGLVFGRANVRLKFSKTTTGKRNCIALKIAMRNVKACVVRSLSFFFGPCNALAVLRYGSLACLPTHYFLK